MKEIISSDMLIKLIEQNPNQTQADLARILSKKLKRDDITPAKVGSKIRHLRERNEIDLPVLPKQKKTPQNKGKRSKPAKSKQSKPGVHIANPGASLLTKENEKELLKMLNQWKSKGSKPGKPVDIAIIEPDKPTQRFTFHLSVNTVKKLKKTSTDMRISPAWFVDLAINEMLDKQ